MENILSKRILNFKDVVEIQSILNEKADPNNPDWKSVRIFEDFKLASAIELFELVESTPWKWWKGASPADIWNVKIELIDMLHFLISNVALNNNLKKEDEDKILGFSNPDFVSKKIFNNGDENEGTNRKEAFNVLKMIVNEDEDFDLIDYVVKVGGLESNEISAIYIAKYTLNEIRWKGGYAFNNYKKMKSGYIDENGNAVESVEDNVFLKSLVDDFKKDETMTLKDLRNKVFEVLENI